jgi:hypothetical protein
MLWSRNAPCVYITHFLCFNLDRTTLLGRQNVPIRYKRFLRVADVGVRAVIKHPIIENFLIS